MYLLVPQVWVGQLPERLPTREPTVYGLGPVATPITGVYRSNGKPFASVPTWCRIVQFFASSLSTELILKPPRLCRPASGKWKFKLPLNTLIVSKSLRGYEPEGMPGVSASGVEPSVGDVVCALPDATHSSMR